MDPIRSRMTEALLSLKGQSIEERSQKVVRRQQKKNNNPLWSFLMSSIGGGFRGLR